MLFMHAVLRECKKIFSNVFDSQSKTKKLERATINWYFKKRVKQFSANLIFLLTTCKNKVKIHNNADRI